ncbi:MAG: HPP family protein [Psychrobium sp.]|nr:HPP family protein [Psychrobium sp.]
MKRLINAGLSYVESLITCSLEEQLIPAIGAAVSIFIVYFVSYSVTGLSGASAILPSMGALIVLLFSASSDIALRPWPIFAGNLLSATVGVFCYQWLGDSFLGASCAVAFSLFAMLVFRCVHAPGGATALAAVVGGDVIHQLGFYYVVVPTLLNCLTIYAVFILFRYLDFKRRL